MEAYCLTVMDISLIITQYEFGCLGDLEEWQMAATIWLHIQIAINAESKSKST